jgi:exodeoxyribonuclease-3
MRVASWNVNGLRSIAGKGFLDWLERSGADIVGVQETRCRPEQLPETVRAPAGWHTHFVSATRPGYSGVALYARRPFDEIETSLGVRSFDAEGRLQLVRWGRLRIANVYFPNGSGVARDNSRVPFKLRFSRRLRRRLQPYAEQGLPVLVIGDFNTAPAEIDLARPKENAGTSGFLPEERAEIAAWLKSGWVDTFREFETGAGHYTWWSQRFGVRERNIGWRIDLVLASRGAVPFLRGAAIHPEVQGSDHCPVSVELDDAILGDAQGSPDALR